MLGIRGTGITPFISGALAHAPYLLMNLLLYGLSHLKGVLLSCVSAGRSARNPLFPPSPLSPHGASLLISPSCGAARTYFEGLLELVLYPFTNRTNPTLSVLSKHIY